MLPTRRLFSLAIVACRTAGACITVAERAYITARGLYNLAADWLTLKVAAIGRAWPGTARTASAGTAPVVMTHNRYQRRQDARKGIERRATSYLRVPSV